ncbi:MAG: EF-P lysine aminoacylase GenX [Bdellovibrionaceae bacterium]|nr:EF-P lysine aminoacylase GenX [Pseudobdellovibrionaceae bacterium]
MTREQYLQQKWVPYPVAPPDVVERGRFLGFAEGGELLLWRQEERIQVPYAESEITSFLVPGDLIALSASGDVLLISPWKTQGVYTPIDSRNLRLWSRAKKAVLEFFDTEGFLEVQTPTLVVCPGTEPSLEVFETVLKNGSRSQKRFLPTSPELHLKKALALGWEKVFEMKTCFRNGEITEVHQPEFTMLEWYRAWQGLEPIENDVIALIEFVRSEVGEERARAPRRIERTTMKELFLKNLNVELKPEMTRADYAQIATEAGLRVTDGDGIDDLFFQLFSEKIEASFDPETLVIVRDWPPFQAALARIGESGWAERFEVYWQGLELANAFHELNDPEIQRLRFDEDLRKKKALGKSDIPLDEGFQRALESGLPPSAGIALGVDRLVMALFGIRQIADLRAFPEKN